MTAAPPVRRRRALAVWLVAGGVGVVLWTEPASASNVAAGLGEGRQLAVPTWLTLLTGATAVAASALLAALVTDRAFVDAIHEWERPITPTVDRGSPTGNRSASAADPSPSATDQSSSTTDSSPSAADPSPSTTARRARSIHRRVIGVGSLLGKAVGVVALAGVIVVGLEGPTAATANLAVLLTFVGVRGLLPMIAVLVVDPWPAIDPYRTVAGVVDAGITRVRRGFGRVSGRDAAGRGATGTAGATGTGAANAPLLEYPSRLASWPAVIGLLGLVWIELVLPVTTDPEILAVVAAGYTLATVGGAVLFSPAVWFRRGDPLAALFRCYGAVAPLQWEDGRLRLVAPGARLRDGDVVTDSSEVAFVLALVWELTFNGFVVTEPGRATVGAIVSLGVAPALAYGLLLWGGFGVTVGCYWLAAHLSRRVAPTYLSERVLARQFAPPLVAIAAGYHLAHYVAFVISLAPAALAALASPFAPPVNPTTLVVPGWMGGLEIAVLLAGHVLAVWTAHAVAFDCFPDRLQAIRSQYPFVAVMVGYTALSLWLLTLPTAGPLYVAG